jgi:hypothetical protein
LHEDLKKYLDYIRIISYKGDQSNLEIKSNITEVFCPNCCNGSLIVATDDFETLFIICQATTVITDLYNRGNGINLLCINFIQDLPENFPLLIVVTDLTFVVTVNLTRVSIT